MTASTCWFYGFHWKGHVRMNGFGRRFNMGMGMAPERLFGRGDIKYLLLDLLKERPKHGYDHGPQRPGRPAAEQSRR